LAGDSCEGTAKKYGISIEQLYTINHWNAEKCKRLAVCFKLNLEFNLKYLDRRFYLCCVK